MKKVLCVVLCLMMALVSTGSLAAITYTLPEKMQKQLDIGSGLKGSLTLHAEGTDPLILSLLPFQDVELQIRGMKSGEELHYYVYQAGENEEQKGLTELYRQGETTWMRSNMLPEEVFLLTGPQALASLIDSPEGGNPSFLPALMAWMNLSGETRNALLEPVVSELSSQLELWAAKYASVSDVRALDNGGSAVDLTYDIPMADMKQEIVELLVQMIRSEQGQALLKQILSDDLQALYANENLDYYYLDALNALDNDYDILYTQTVSTLGDSVSSTLELPLDEARMGYQALVIETEGDLASYTLRSEERLLTVILARNLDWEKMNGFSGWIITRPNPSAESGENAEYHALRVDVRHETFVSVDEENRDHQLENWKVEAVRDVTRLPEGEDVANYPEETPRTLEARLHYYSRYSQSSPTTLEIEASWSRENLDLRVTGTMKTASPWIFTPFDTEGAVDITSLTPAQWEVKLAEFLAAAGEQLAPAEQQEPATMTDLSADLTEKSEAEQAPALVTEEEEAVE